MVHWPRNLVETTTIFEMSNRKFIVEGKKVLLKRRYIARSLLLKKKLMMGDGSGGFHTYKLNVRRRIDRKLAFSET